MPLLLLIPLAGVGVKLAGDGIDDAGNGTLKLALGAAALGAAYYVWSKAK